MKVLKKKKKKKKKKKNVVSVRSDFRKIGEPTHTP